MSETPIYLDHNATTPCDPRVLEAMLPFFSNLYGNAASRSHRFGWQASEAVDIAREQVAALIGCEKQEIVFTSGATESINLAIKGVFETYAVKGRHIITCETEHPAVLDSCAHLGKAGAEISRLPVDASGMISLAELEAAIRPDTILVSLMYANNETGVIQPIPEIGRITSNKQVLFLTDATQAVGKIPVDVLRDQVDLLALSAHKFYGPKGVGALYVRRRNPRVSLAPQLDGGGHERGKRSGTLNVPGIVGLGKACELCGLEMDQEAPRLRLLRDQLQEALLAIPGTVLNGHPLARLPQTVNISFSGIDSQVLMSGFSRELAVSSGSACSSASPEPSLVLRAMGLDEARAYGSVRFGLGRFTSGDEIKRAIRIVQNGVSRLNNGANQFVM